MSQPAPLFVLAAPFSGSSWIAAVLGRHPDLCALPELDLFMAGRVDDLLAIDRLDQGVTGDGLLRAVAQLEFGAQTDAAIAQAQDWLAARAGHSTGAILQALAARAAPRRLVVPDSSAALRPMDLRRMVRQLPGLRVLHLLRHPWAQGCRMAAWARERLFVPVDFLDHGNPPPRVEPQIPWLRANRNLDALETTLPYGELRRLRIEDYEADPAAALQPLCAWLGIRFDAEVAAAMHHPQDWTFAGLGPPAAPYGLEADVLEPLPEADLELAEQTNLDLPLPWRDDGRRFEPEVRACASKHGY